jgi:hypothetical protein
VIISDLCFIFATAIYSRAEVLGHRVWNNSIEHMIVGLWNGAKVPCEFVNPVVQKKTRGYPVIKMENSQTSAYILLLLTYPFAEGRSMP